MLDPASRGVTLLTSEIVNAEEVVSKVLGIKFTLTNFRFMG